MKLNNFLNKRTILFIIIIFIFILYLISLHLFRNNLFFKNNYDFYNFTKNYYFFIAFLFIIFTSSVVIKNKFYYYDDFILFGLIFLYSCFWINKGVDLTDEGFIITKAWFIFDGLMKENADFMWLTTLLGGLWLRIAGFASILWERIGYSLIISLFGLVSYKILKKEFPGIFTFFAVVTSSVIIRLNIQTVNYNNLPTLFIIFGTYFLYKSEHSTKKAPFFIVTSGLLFGISFFCRFTNLVFLFLPILFFSVKIVFDKNFLNNIGKILFFYLGTLAAIIFAFFILFTTKSLNSYLKNIYYMFFQVLITGKAITGNELSVETHSLKFLLIKIYLNHTITSLRFLLYPFLLTFIIHLIVGRIKNIKLKKMFLFFFSLIIGIIFYYFIFKYNKKQSSIFTISLIVINFLLLLLTDINFKKNFFIIFWGIFIAFFSFLGSDLGFKTMFSSGGIIILLPASFLLIYNSNVKLINTNFNFKYYSIFVLVSLLIAFIVIQNRFIYRDEARKNLKVFSEIKELACIYTNETKRKALDEIYHYFKNKNLPKETRLLIINSQPLLYTLLNHKYYFITPWAPWIFLNDLDLIEIKFNEYKEQNLLPEYIIFPFKNSREVGWPLSNTLCKKSDEKAYKFFKDICESNLYELEFSNIGYLVYKIKK